MKNIFKNSLIYILKNSWIILITAVIIFIAFNISLRSETNSNIAENKVFIHDNNKKYDADSYDYFENMVKSDLLARDYSELIKTRYFLNKLLINLKTHITATNLDNTRIILIQAKYHTPKGSVIIANETAVTLKNELKNTFMMDNVNIFENAVKSTSTNNFISLKNLIFWFALSIIFGLIIISIKNKINSNVINSSKPLYSTNWQQFSPNNSTFGLLTITSW